MPFLMSAIILRRSAGMREFTDEFVPSAPVQQMMPRVTAVFDPGSRRRASTRSAASSKSISSMAGRSCSRQTIAIAADRTSRSRARSCKAKFGDCAQLVLPQNRLPGVHGDRVGRYAAGRPAVDQSAVIEDL